jgi:hypothetical protein
VEPEVRERALAAGFDQVVPRSRMAREGGQLVEGCSPTAVVERPGAREAYAQRLEEVRTVAWQLSAAPSTSWTSSPSSETA